MFEILACFQIAFSPFILPFWITSSVISLDHSPLTLSSHIKAICTTLIILFLSIYIDSNWSLTFLSFDLPGLFFIAFILNPLPLFLLLSINFCGSLLSKSDILPPFMYNVFNKFMLFFSIFHPSLSCSFLSRFLTHTFLFCYTYLKILYLFWLLAFFFRVVAICVNAELSVIYLGHLELANICACVASYRYDFKLL